MKRTGVSWRSRYLGRRRPHRYLDDLVRRVEQEELACCHETADTAAALLNAATTVASRLDHERGSLILDTELGTVVLAVSDTPDAAQFVDMCRLEYTRVRAWSDHGRLRVAGWSESWFLTVTGIPGRA